MRKKSADPFFDVYRNVIKEKNYNPLGVKLLWVEAMQVVRVPCVACFNSFIEQPVNPWLNHVCHHEQPVPLGL